MTDHPPIETFRATAQGTGWPTRVAISQSDWVFQVDEPTEDGGSNSGPNPLHHFLASLAGCQNEQAQVVAEELGVEVKEIQITLEVDLNLAGFMGQTDNSEGSFQGVRIEAQVSGVTADQASSLGQRVDARCPILSLLRSAGTPIESAWTHK
ncbi:MAG: OsmC family protein [Planctomycetota bacterium]|nr:OsmC family protein [Planctomycetota bacterium]